MRKVTKKDWLTYKDKLAQISQTAADELTAWIDAHGGVGEADRDDLIAYAYALTSKYGEASGAYTAQYYDDMARLSGVNVPTAEVAEIPSYGEVAKAINGTIKRSSKSSYVGSTSGRLVKQVSADTLQKNALRDGAEWAWIPAGDTCSFCLTLASRGWQRASKKALKNGHAEHIHANCDCTYAVRFDSNTDVEGYEPEKYLAMYQNAEGDTPQEKISTMRRIQYQSKKKLDDGDKSGKIKYRKNTGRKLIEKKERDSRVISALNNGDITLKINSETQSKHIIGSDEYNSGAKKSYFTISEEELQIIIDRYHGTGTIIVNGNQIKEIMVVPGNIGVSYDYDGNPHGPTNKLTVHYSKNRTHAVPARNDRDG